MANKGFLLVQMQPPAAFEEEFNAWYDSDHLAERLAVPGFETARRFVCIDGSPRYLAMYDLADIGVLESAAYLTVSGNRANPWTQRVTRTARVSRHIGVQRYPGDRLTGDPTRVLLLRFSALPDSEEAPLIDALHATFEGPALAGLRLLATQAEPTSRCFAWIELRFPHAHELSRLGGFAERLDTVNTYTRY